MALSIVLKWDSILEFYNENIQFQNVRKAELQKLFSISAENITHYCTVFTVSSIQPWISN